MFRLTATAILSSVAFAQAFQDADVSAAAKSPLTLKRYVESRSIVDWKALRNALGLRESEYWFAPCGGDAPANDAPCSAQTVTVADPDQTIVIIRSRGVLSFTDEYLRYLRGPSGDWKFAGEHLANKRFGPSGHALVRPGTKPFLKISSNHSQNGMGIQQEVEDWFDLTLPDFEPVFSLTTDGSAGGFAFTIVRDIKAQCSFMRVGQLEQIIVTLNVRFSGTPGLGLQNTYVGVYERHTNEKNFTLRTAYSGLGRHTTIPTNHFEDLADPFTDPAKETFMSYALPGLKKIASGSDADDKEWLRDLLDHARDTVEKQVLLELLAKR